MQSRKQIGWRERVIDGRIVRVRVIAPREQKENEVEPMAARDDSRKPGQRYMRERRTLLS